VPDIQALLKRKDRWFELRHSQAWADAIATQGVKQFIRGPEVPQLRISGLGPKCPKALWHSVHTPELAEPFPPWAELKFAFGDVIEALAIQLARASGHEVTGEQDELWADGVKGHRDCVIDGAVVDVKSCNSRQFEKFKRKQVKGDPFIGGYLDQLGGYILGSQSDPLVRSKDRGFILAINKELGHVALYEHRFDECECIRLRQRIIECKRVVGLHSPPPCQCGTLASGASGNIRLDTVASYNPYKFCCFPTLRVFVYAEGPAYLTHVERKPDVTEVNRLGEVIC
jgi:hypothetical protein